MGSRDRGSSDSPRQLEWNRKIISSGCEVLRLSSFESGSRYADYLNFIAAHTASGSEGDVHFHSAVQTWGIAIASVWPTHALGQAAAVLQLDLPLVRNR